MFGLSELALLLVVVVILIGIRKLPDLVRSAGKATRILKSEAAAMKADDTAGTPRVIQVRPEEVIRKPHAAEGAEN